MDDAAVPGAPLKPPSWRKALDALGFLLGFVAVGFVGLRLKAYAGQIALAHLSAGAVVALVALALVSGLANALLGLAWWRLLRLVRVRVTPRWAIRAHGVSQIGKYVPGNVFQFAGRQAIGVAAGLPAGPLARSVLWELGLLASVGALLALLAVPLVWPDVPRLAILALWLLGALAMRIRGGRTLLLAARAHFLFVAIYGTVFVAVLAIVRGPQFDLSTAPDFFGAFVVAWLLGLVTPGAPAGGGVREAVLLYLLAHRVAEADLLLAIVLGRAVNVVGDVAFFTLASLLPRTEARHEAA